MKKFIVIIIISVVVVSLLTISWYSIAKFLDIQKMLGKDEIIEIFEKNKDHFLNIRNSMSNFRYDWDICKNRNIGSGWKVCTIKGNLYLGIRRQENFNQLNIMKKTAEKEESIKYLLKELEFKDIQYSYWSDSEYIDFTKQASTGNVAGILYCVRGNPTSHPYAKNIFDLGEGWYYYGTR